MEFKYEIMDYTRGELFNTGFNDPEAAIEEAKKQWSNMSEYDQKKCDAFFVLECEDPDEDSEAHLSGNPIFTIK